MTWWEDGPASLLHCCLIDFLYLSVSLCISLYLSTSLCISSVSPLYIFCNSSVSLCISLHLFVYLLYLLCISSVSPLYLLRISVSPLTLCLSTSRLWFTKLYIFYNIQRALTFRTLVRFCSRLKWRTAQWMQRCLACCRRSVHRVNNSNNVNCVQV